MSRQPAHGDQIMSELPRFLVKRSEDFPAWLIVTCPRENCGQTFIVKKSTWLSKKVYKSKDREVVIMGRPCPYCSKVGKPGRP